MATTLSYAETLDLSRLPPFSVVHPAFEAILAERLASLAARMVAQGLDPATLQYESDPLVQLEQEDAYREFLNLQAVNDAARSNSLAFAKGEKLDHIAATFYAHIGVRRLTGEDDARFRRRIALAPEAASPFTPGAYTFAALTVGLDVADARPLNYASGLVQPGEILLSILPAPGVNAADLVARVGAALAARPIQALTDTVIVQAAPITVAPVSAVLELSRGPDHNLVEAEARARLAAYAAGRRRIGLRLAPSGISAALHLPAADNLRLLAPTLPVDPGPAGVVELGAVELTIELAQ